MSVEVTDLFVANASGEPVRTFRGGDRIGFNLHFTVRDVPVDTQVRVTYYIWALNPVAVGSVKFLFHPYHKWDNEHRISPGSWRAWSTWRLPDSDPTPGSMSMSRWRRLLDEHWRMRSWPLRWEFHGFVRFTEPPRSDVWDDGQPPWRYDITY